MKKHIPNIITLGNLTCGLFSIWASYHSEFYWLPPLFILGGLFLDFFDGFFARILKVDGEMGKQLDSLADLVTFGVAPGIIMFNLMNFLGSIEFMFSAMPIVYIVLPFTAFLIPVLSALRLAKFNVSTNQSDQFIGLPTPANAIFFASIPLILLYNETPEESILKSLFSNVFSLSGIIIVFSLLLNANLPLIALKFKTFGWKGNEVRFIFLGLCLVTILVALLISNVFVAVPIIILLYLIISIINNITKRKNEIQSKH